MIQSLQASLGNTTQGRRWGFWLAGSLVVLWLLTGLVQGSYSRLFSGSGGEWVALGLILAAGAGTALGFHLVPSRRRLGGLLFISGILTLVAPGIFLALPSKFVWAEIVSLFVSVLAIGGLLVLLPLGIVTSLLARPVPDRVAEIIKEVQTPLKPSREQESATVSFLSQLDERFQEASRAAREALTAAERELVERREKFQALQRSLKRIEGEKEDLRELLEQLRGVVDRTRYPVRQHLISFLFGVAGSIVAAWVAPEVLNTLGIG